jgi:glycerol-3-phosphate dehydrogenase (NAD+)
MSLEKVCIIGSGNWGSTVAKIIGENVNKNLKVFDPVVEMWVYEELVDGKPLTEIINTKHENVKYLPNIKLPSNVHANPDVLDAARSATLLVFVVPHNFLSRTCEKLSTLNFDKNKVFGISLIKGLESATEEDKSIGLGLGLASDLIKHKLGISVSVLMGANIANEIALEKFSESTLGCVDSSASKWLLLFNTPYFLVSTVKDIAGVELCGALKNIVAFAAGLVDGLKLGDNTKAAIIRIGLLEMRQYINFLYPGTPNEIFFQSCGIADIITSCYGGRNRKVGQAMAETNLPLDVLEKEILKGQHLQGPQTLLDVIGRLKSHPDTSLIRSYPLFVAVHKICYENHSPTELTSMLSNYESKL